MCKYCEHENNAFVMLNETAEYSGIEIAMNRQGVLRVRYHELEISNREFYTQDIVQVKFCPMCGRKMI